MNYILTFILFGLLFLSSCSDLDQAGAQLTNEVSRNAPKATQLYEKGLKAEQKGDYKEAAKQYDQLAKKYPTFEKSAEANFKAGQYWEKVSEPVNAFDSYHEYIQRYRNGAYYKDALDRQSAIAFSASEGGLTKKFLGLNQEPQYNDVVGLLSKVRENAPASDLAARSQFAIGSYSEGQEKTNEAIASYFKVTDDYPDHHLSPEATLRAGKLLSGITEDGNQNTNNLQRAKNTLEDLIQQYPSSTQATEARTLVSKISDSSIQRTFDVAEFYEKKDKISSAKYYYEEVLNKTTAGTELHTKAQEKLNSLQ